jgi:hypothetical protein
VAPRNIIQIEWGAPRYREACAGDSGTLSRGSIPRATASHQQILILMDGARPAAGIVWHLFAAAQPRFCCWPGGRCPGGLLDLAAAAVTSIRAIVAERRCGVL